MAPEARPPDTDVVVVGAGPAGLAAAVTALLGGLRVTIVDAGHAPGGQYWRHPPADSGVTDTAVHHHDLDTYAALVRRLAGYGRSGRAEILLQHHAWTAVARDDAVEVQVVDRAAHPERARVVTGRRLVVATGAYDRPLPFPGWDLPGVLTAGALQALLKAGGVPGGHRAVVAGTGPFLLPVATSLAVAGADVLAVCEAGGMLGWSRHLAAAAALPGKALEGAHYAAALARHRIPVRTRTAVVAAHGTDRVESVTLARLDRLGAVVPGTEQRLEVDVVGTGWGFLPQLDLPITLGCRLHPAADGTEVVAVDADQRTSVPAVLVAGEGCGVGGAQLALREGQVAGQTVLADLGGRAVTGARRMRFVHKEIARLRRFADAMHEVHRVPPGWTGWLTDDTLVCRCEEVSVARVREAVADGAHGARQVKQLTRAGMGWCQGRICGYAAHCLSTPPGEPAAYRADERLLAFPVTLGALADLDAP